MRGRRGRPPKLNDPVTAWAKDVITGKIIAGPHVRNAGQRHLLDLEFGPERGLRWDLKAARYAIGFFPSVLRLAGGQFEGQEFHLQPSQQFIIGSLFGWKREDGTRRFRRAYIEQSKGNGKTPMSAGIGLYCLVADGEARAEVYAAAANAPQAQVMFRDAVAMRNQSPALRNRLTTSGGNPVWNLADIKSGSFFRPMSGEIRRTGSGPRPSCALCDEIHEHPDGATIEMLERGFKWRQQPLLVMTTNSGSDRQSICWQEHDWAVKVAAGTLTPDERGTFVGEVLDGGDQEFSFVCGLDVDDDPLEDPSCWIKANPLLDITMTRENLAEAVSQAKAIPGKLNGILRLHFNVWTDADQAWMARQTLEQVLVDFDPLEHAGRRIYIGADLSASKDLTPLAFVVPTGTVQVERTDPESGFIRVVTQPTFDAWVEAWTPGDTVAQRSLKDHAPYDIWVREGHLNAPPGRLIRMDHVAARVAEVEAEYQVECLAYDAYAFRRQFEEALDQVGVTVRLIEHPQGGKRKASESGLWMPGSVSELEACILEGRIRIRRSPIIISAIMSAAIESDPFDNRWFSKRRATNRIDPLVALAMAIGAATAEDAGQPTYQMFVA
jgi:phage terminase large subunit-like protein